MAWWVICNEPQSDFKEGVNFNNDSLNTLVNLGLNGSQARVYLALLDLGTVSVRDVSKLRRIPRPDVYRAIISLEDLGLIERVITNPTRYTPLPIQDAISILMAKKDKENFELHIRATTLYEEYKEKRVSNDATVDTNQFIQIPEGDALKHKLQKIGDSAQKNICAVLSQKKLLPWLLYDETISKALDRGLIVKVLTERNSGLVASLDELKKKHTFEIRFTIIPLFVNFRIYDAKEVVLTLESSDRNPSPVVWSNNLGLVELAESYFNVGWSTAGLYQMKNFKTPEQ